MIVAAEAIHLDEIGDAPEIPWKAAEVVGSWARVIGHGVDADTRRANFSRACVELWRLAENEPPAVRQVIIDRMAALATGAGIDDDEAQAIMAGAKDALPPVKETSKQKTALTKRCANCRHFHPDVTVGTPVVVIGDVHGECRSHSPRYSDNYGGQHNWRIWPVTSEQDWCSEFQEWADT